MLPFQRLVRTPSGQPCIMWNRHTWIDSVEIKIPDWKQRESMIYSALYSRGFLVHGTRRQGPPFLRFVKYVISALIEADTSDTETMERIDAVVAFMDRAKEFNRQRALEQPTVRSRSQAWLKSLGRRMRDSVQPKKRPQQPDGQVDTNSTCIASTAANCLQVCEITQDSSLLLRLKPFFLGGGGVG